MQLTKLSWRAAIFAAACEILNFSIHIGVIIPWRDVVEVLVLRE